MSKRRPRIVEKSRSKSRSRKQKRGKTMTCLMLWTQLLRGR